MLILRRCEGQRIVTSCGVTVTIVRIRGNQVKVGVEAPEEVWIAREEVADQFARRDNRDSGREDIGR